MHTCESGSGPFGFAHNPEHGHKSVGKSKESDNVDKSVWKSKNYVKSNSSETAKVKKLIQKLQGDTLEKFANPSRRSGSQCSPARIQQDGSPVLRFIFVSRKVNLV